MFGHPNDHFTTRFNARDELDQTAARFETLPVEAAVCVLGACRILPKACCYILATILLTIGLIPARGEDLTITICSFL